MPTAISLIAVILCGFLFSFFVIIPGETGFHPVSLFFYFLIITPCVVVFRKILNDQDKKDSLTGGRSRFWIGLIFFGLPIIVAVSYLIVPGLFVYSSVHKILFCTSFFSTVILAVHIVAVVYALYLLENIYRYALLYQRRIGFVSFAGFLILILHQLLFSTRFLLYGCVPLSWIKFAAFIYILPLCAVLWSFSKYRMGSEKIKATRDAVYSSFSLLIVGSLFTAVGVTTSILRIFHIELSPFDFKVLGVTVVFGMTILAGSARMRRRIAKLINRRFYTSAHDYRSQFFSLPKTLVRTDGYDETLEDVLEHLRRTFNMDHAYLFITDEQNGNFQLMPPKERNLPDSVIINNSSSLIATLLKKGDYFGLLQVNDSSSMHIDTDNRSDLAKLKITHVCPVLHYDKLLAVLALRCDGRRDFNTEDTAVVESYASITADLIFKHRILEERLEQKQFESFSHMASFIVHDVKNQVSTLKLLLKNAENNISNPGFQKSLLVSLRSCSENLSNLVSKLSMPPRQDRLKIIKSNISTLIEKLIEDTGLLTSASVEFEKEIEPGLNIEIDENALYYTIKNLVTNALESMEGKKGRLVIKALTIQNSISQFLTRFPGSEGLISKYLVLIAVEDTGKGISEDFLQNRLFRPFATTKDKGIGIGLYQCKTLVEKMGGKILCDSQIDQGTLFCIILR